MKILNYLKKLNRYFNRLTCKLSWIDLKIVSWYGLFLGILLAKVAPKTLDVPVRFYILGAVVCALRILFVLFVKKNKCEGGCN